MSENQQNHLDILSIGIVNAFYTNLQIKQSNGEDIKNDKVTEECLDDIFILHGTVRAVLIEQLRLS